MAPRYALPDFESDPDQSDTSPQPSDKELERALRETVAQIFKTGKTEELTVKRVRLAAEKALQIEEGFFKSNDDWKARSDEIIKDEVEVQDNAAPESKAGEKDESAGTPPSDTGKATKRAKPKASSKSHKRRKISTESKADSGISDDDSEGEATKGTKEPKARAKVESELSEKISSDSDAGENQDTKSAEQKAEAAAGDSENEMSVVLDEEPQPKRQRQKSTGTTTTKVKKKETKAPAKAKDADADPNQAEIKRLQGWLLKCGIRKMWARELAPYDTPKSKIKHLKDMLKEVGMEGRYSLEKARQIKEQRELREDLEMVQEGAKRWGKSTAEDDSNSGQPRRRLNRGRQSLAFLESEGEETD